MSDPDRRDGITARNAAQRRSDPIEEVSSAERSAYETEISGTSIDEYADFSRHESVETPDDVLDP